MLTFYSPEEVQTLFETLRPEMRWWYARCEWSIKWRFSPLGLVSSMAYYEILMTEK
jgi:hypothetical protein